MTIHTTTQKKTESTTNLLRQIRFQNRCQASKLINRRKIPAKLNRDMLMDVSKSDLMKEAEKQKRNKNTRRNPSITPPKSNRESHKICRGLKSQVTTKLIMGKDNIAHG